MRSRSCDSGPFGEESAIRSHGPNDVCEAMREVRRSPNLRDDFICESGYVLGSSEPHIEPEGFGLAACRARRSAGFGVRQRTRPTQFLGLLSTELDTPSGVRPTGVADGRRQRQGTSAEPRMLWAHGLTVRVALLPSGPV